MMLAMGVQAGELLYAEVDGTNMTLKCGDAAPEGTQKYDGSDTWNLSFCKTITTATIDESCASHTGTTLALLFSNCYQLEAITGLNNLNTANVTRMVAMFYNCKALTTIYVSSWDTGNVTESSEMFWGCTSLVGGAGTAWSNKNADDCTLARIDGGSGAPGYFTDINSTSIKDATTSKMTEHYTPCYNLQGQRLTSAPQKGIYIQNGKKVVMK